MNLENIKLCCRTCSSLSKNVISLQKIWNKNLRYSEILSYIFKSSLPADLEENVPDSICKVCEKQIILAYSFKKLCEETDQKLLLILSSSKNTIDPFECAPEEVIEELRTEIVESIDEAEDHSHPENEEITTEEMDRDVQKKIRHCLKCNLEFTDTKKYQMHHRQHHLNRNLCPLCGKFIVHQSMEKHIALHDKKLEQYLCTLCGKSFIIKDNLRKHQRIHEEDKRYTCEYCGEKFVHWNSRRSHIRTVHTGEKKYECSICQKKFAQSSNMFRHIRLHTNDLPHKCTYCEKKFLSSTEMKNHLVVHTKERNHLCATCNKAFGTKKALRTHEKIHTGEKDYKCPVCPKEFSQAHVLRKHMKTHSNLVIPAPGVVLSKKALNKQKLTFTESEAHAVITD